MNFKDLKKSPRQTQKFLSFEIIRYRKGKGPPEIKI